MAANRAERRAHQKRVFAKRVKSSHYWGKLYLLKSTGTPCSCYMCGNPRRAFKAVSRQEMVADLNFKEQLAEAV